MLRLEGTINIFKNLTIKNEVRILMETPFAYFTICVGLLDLRYL